MKIKIKNRFTGNIILCGDYESIKDCLEKNRGADLRGANLWGADLWGADLWAADLRGADLRGANLWVADLWSANLRGADLRGTNLCGANLWGADLWAADLWGANLWGANLRGAKGIKLPIISISGSCHTLQYISGKIKIGCENHTVEKWLKDYKKIGKNYDYTAAEIKEYGEYIKMCAKFAKGKAK